jgi:hypothetical protein
MSTSAFVPGSQADPRPVHNLIPWWAGHPSQDHQAQSPPRQRRGFPKNGGRGRNQRAQERHAGASGGRLRGYRRG